MVLKNKFEKLQDATMKHLKDIRSKIDPRTFSAFQKDIFSAVGPSALYKLQGKFETINDLEPEQKYTKTAVKKEINQANKIKNMEAVKYFKQPMQNFYLKADLKLTKYYKRTAKAKSNKNGRVKGEVYSYEWSDPTIIPIEVNDFSKIVVARTAEEAKKEFISLITSEMTASDKEYEETKTDIENINITQNINAEHFESAEPEMMMMKKYEPLKYNFIPSDDNLLNNDGFCVIDNFVSTYGPKIAKATREWFISQIYILNNMEMNM